jgi:hypothetical protein
MKMLLFFYAYYFGREVYPDAMQWLSGSPRGGQKRKHEKKVSRFFVSIQ